MMARLTAYVQTGYGAMVLLNESSTDLPGFGPLYGIPERGKKLI